MALILGKVVDVLVTACGFFVVEVPPLASCPVADSLEIRLLIRFCLFVTRPIHGICADCILSSMLPGAEQEAARIVSSVLRCAGHRGVGWGARGTASGFEGERGRSGGK